MTRRVDAWQEEEEEASSCEACGCMEEASSPEVCGWPEEEARCVVGG